MRSISDFSNLIPNEDGNFDLTFEFGHDKYEINAGDYYPTFSYRYLNIKHIPEFCFNHPEFNVEDYHKYFQHVKLYSNHTVDGNLGKSKFKIGKPNAKLLQIIQELSGTEGKLKDEQIPPFGHFHLSDTQKIDGEVTKRPVIHFMVGNHAILHILIYDPYHQIHPTTH